MAGLVTLDSLNVPDSDPADAPARYRDWLDTLTHGAAVSERVYASVDAFAERLARRYPELDAATRYFLAEAWLRRTADGRWQLRADPAHRRRMPYGFRAEDAAALWREVRCPVLCIDGGRSPAAAYVTAETLAARRACFTDVEHRVLAECGHMLHLQNAPAVAAALRSFLHALDATG